MLCYTHNTPLWLIPALYCFDAIFLSLFFSSKVWWFYSYHYLPLLCNTHNIRDKTYINNKLSLMKHTGHAKYKYVNCKPEYFPLYYTTVEWLHALLLNFLRWFSGIMWKLTYKHHIITYAEIHSLPYSKLTVIFLSPFWPKETFL